MLQPRAAQQCYLQEVRGGINKHITQYNKELAQTINNYKIESQDLQGKLSKFELKANKISKHPKMLENRINKGTQEVNHCFEQISKGEEC